MKDKRRGQNKRRGNYNRCEATRNQQRPSKGEEHGEVKEGTKERKWVGS